MHNSLIISGSKPFKDVYIMQPILFCIRLYSGKLQTSYGSKLFDVLEEFADYLTLSSNLAGIATSKLLPCIMLILYGLHKHQRILN